ncbi:response regulator transcription factor, partial [Bacteroides reticulotermitis]
VDLLSSREKEILQLIDRGKISKDISELLSISKNTVDRHRQNILEKLRVKNSIEACRIAKLMKLI